MLLKVFHNPIAKKRHRHSKGRVYDPQSVDKRAMKWHFASQMRNEGILKLSDGPLDVSMTVFMPKPKSWSKKRLKEAEGKPVTTKPDVDNIEKFYLDVLNGIAYSDDKLISSLWCQKFYSDIPRVLIDIKPFGEEMVNEHAITIKDDIKFEDLDYMIKKANKLGKSGRQIIRVYCEEDNEGKHIYFEVEGLKPTPKIAGL